MKRRVKSMVMRVEQRAYRSWHRLCSSRLVPRPRRVAARAHELAATVRVDRDPTLDSGHGVEFRVKCLRLGPLF